MINAARGPTLEPGKPTSATHTALHPPSLSLVTESSQKAPAASHSFDLPEPKLTDLPSSPFKGATDPNDGVTVEALGSTGDCNIDSTVEVSGDNADQGGDEADSGSDSWESAVDSGPKSATRNCLICSENEEAAIESTHKTFWKKVQASCSIAKGCLWIEAQLRQIGDSHHTVWGSNCEVIKTKWDLALKEDCSSFEVNKMTLRTDQLLQIKEATHPKIYPCEPKAEVHRRKKTLVQSLAQFHAHFYWLYEKGMTHAMVSLQGLY